MIPFMCCVSAPAIHGTLGGRCLPVQRLSAFAAAWLRLVLSFVCVYMSLCLLCCMFYCSSCFPAAWLRLSVVDCPTATMAPAAACRYTCAYACMYVRIYVCTRVTDQPMLGESCCLSEDMFVTCAAFVLPKLCSGTGASKNGSEPGPRPSPRRGASPRLQTKVTNYRYQYSRITNY